VYSSLVGARSLFPLVYELVDPMGEPHEESAIECLLWVESGRSADKSRST